jgi:uncharacterized caspase-like protein
MRRAVSAIAITLGFSALICGVRSNAQTQQSNPSTFIQTYETAAAKARDECKALWSDRVFDPLRSRVPLGDEKPTFLMLTNKEKLRPKDRPLADLAIKTVEKCRSLLAPVVAMLPTQMLAVIQGIQRKQDALNAELYNGKITFGEYNVAMNRLSGEITDKFSGISATPGSESTTPQRNPAKPENQAQVPNEKPQQTVIVSATASNEIRMALVIGNSDYASLPKLPNPANDARSIAEILVKMGYQTQLLLDASDQKIRNSIRQFANETSKSDVAVVYYAGHGAQLNGSNYLLPTDMDIPRTEADIQFEGLKVDDLVNSIKSHTKIVFLDACRDNPVLFKNIVQGRGASPVGLAPAVGSNFEQAKLGGGVFIAYATDAGAVADDGRGPHSPFAQALLRYMQNPISIDDMFSLVTKEVRLVTKNAQRPYKYASLENIVCLAPACSTSRPQPAGDIFQQATQSENDELQIALQTNNPDALETYLQKYPETSERREIQSKIENARRSEFTEWTLYEIGDLHTPSYIQLSSIYQYGERAAARVREPIDPSKVWKMPNGKALPEAAYFENLTVFDCVKPAMAIAENSVFNQSGDLIYHYKWGDPQYLNISIGVAVQKGTVASVGRNISCHAEINTPLASKKQIAQMEFKSLSSTLTGDGEIFYAQSQSKQDSRDQCQKTVVAVLKNNEDHNVKDFFQPGTEIADPPNYRTEVDRILIKCDEDKFAIVKTEFWNASNQLVRLSVVDPDVAVQFSEIKELSPFKTLQQITCGTRYVGLGIRFKLDNGAVHVAEVFNGSPAEKVGIKVDDIITLIDNEPVSELTQEQIMTKIRGPANTKIVLTILRDGRDKPIELIATRENVKMQPRQ